MVDAVNLTWLWRMVRFDDNNRAVMSALSWKQPFEIVPTVVNAACVKTYKDNNERIWSMDHW